MMQNQFNVYQCKECRTIVADSSCFTGKDEDLGMVSFRNTPNVLTINQKIYTSLKGKDKYCTFQTISCRKCSNILGRLYYGTTPNLDFFRNAFAFHYDTIISYEIGHIREIPIPPHTTQRLECHEDSEDEFNKQTDQLDFHKSEQITKALTSSAKRLSITHNPQNKENYRTATPRRDMR
ncbi:Protein Mis18-alpha [Thelohanellus kitauei]|uniref:Protein Mis18-alpha n=1 Tax=Thelohanellus kitauei TaxID=669202 RepID=A0A0C2JIJ6_THEKT|nr:Protein Mis18-alpha [Thelohanellus kitauei]